MKTFSLPDQNCPADTQDALMQDGLDLTASDLAFAASPLPIIGRGEAAGIALGFAHGESDDCGEDRFSLLVVDAEGEVLVGLGPFGEDDIVAMWRDFAAKSGLPRMIIREGGGLATVSRQLGRVALGTTRQRRRHGLLNGRRPRFLVRRKSARLPARPQIYRNENEIIARS
ncbi:DUF6101 family protein [Methylobacterium haplocladii]|uniref:Uncharacterized protein n=1 Tax=Methylobacterium haplocladii TaxID=1176176 RepID=A0A512IT60_9HYPH|nr:DUF6101 family protein [Methylobacterium haplocladii]GEP00883.1 hypothetical protein MHA02_32700 [Methylobacterium haplocladii]GJD82209.1 hypothetical protein HPGCJGGD_0060 [Methylobacterium haplocladii]GLS60794.1 hypothetical protein GCM10007887_34820 [Methylobacterium haplocladii]